MSYLRISRTGNFVSFKKVLQQEQGGKEEGKGRRRREGGREGKERGKEGRREGKKGGGRMERKGGERGSEGKGGIGISRSASQARGGPWTAPSVLNLPG